ncbi:MAG: helix-turn-helix transcriptional regulator [Candidatus Altiarchaeota archaeon]|nr:helix-turn-helix transcriptional regulator [Candidatus Altiarchaeota archaeon]
MIQKGHRHGHDMMRYINKRWGGFNIGPSFLYNVLQWLKENRYITGQWGGMRRGNQVKRL